MSKSIEKYDYSLKEDEHFQVHGEMLPYIGPLYESQRILIISESHFVPENISIPTDDEWYRPESIEKLLSYIEYNSCTREIIEKIFDEKIKPHPLFRNLRSSLNELNLKIEHIAWYNYFQKPAKNKDSIKPTIEDVRISLRVFEKISNTIQPNIIIFASIKAFDSYISQSLSQASNFYFVPHPNSNWWNKQSKKYGDGTKVLKRTGKQKFIDVLSANLKN